MNRNTLADTGSTPGDQDALAAELVGYDCRLFGDRFDAAESILTSDWLAERDRLVAERHRQEWADYFENWTASVGPEPLTVEGVISALRRSELPFGCADRIEADTHDVRDDLQREFGGGL